MFFSGGVRETLKDWVVIPNTMKYASWNSFHNKHKDQIKSSLRVRNGAMNDLTVETDGVLIDLTAPILTYLYDGSNADLDLDFQVGYNVILLHIVLFYNRLFINTSNIQCQL